MSEEVQEQAVENGESEKIVMDDLTPLEKRMSNLPIRGLDDRFSMRIPAIHEAQHTAEKTHGRGHWKVAVLKFIHSETVQNILTVLLIADVIILFIELYLVGTYPPCRIIERDAISCCAPPDSYLNATTTEESAAGHEHLLRFLAGGEQGDDGHHNLCAYPAVESHEFEATCDTHKWSTVHKVEGILFILTITILSIFFVELMTMVVVLGKSFFKQFFYVLDLFIVTTSLSLEIAFAIIHEDYLIAMTGILLFGRIWRFVRIGHGLIEVTAEYAAKDKKVLLEYAEELENMLKENNIALPEKSKHLIHIEKHISHHSAE